MVYEAEDLPSIAYAMERLRRSMQDDHDYANGWYCNLATVIEMQGVDQDTARKAAAAFLKLAFEIDPKSNEYIRKDLP